MKTRKNLNILLGVLAVVITFSATSLYAQQRERVRFDRPGGFMQGGGGAGAGFMGGEMGSMRLFRMAEQLDLTKEQRNSIARIIDNTQPKMRDNMFKLMDARKAMRELMSGKKKVDDRELRSLTRDQGDTMAELMYLRLKMHNDIRNVLTDEQLAKLDSMRERGKRMRGDRGPDRRDGRGWHRNGNGNSGPQPQDNQPQG